MSRLFIAQFDDSPIEIYGLFYNDENGIRQPYKENFEEDIFETREKAYAKLESLMDERRIEDDAIPYTLDEARQFIKNRSWKFAKTCAKTDPHDYVIKAAVPPPYRNQFDRFVATIRTNPSTMIKDEKEDCIFICDEYYYQFERQMDKVAAHLIRRTKLSHLVLKDGIYYYDNDAVKADIKMWAEEQQARRRQRKAEEQERMENIKRAATIQKYADQGIEIKYDKNGNVETYKDGKFSGYIVPQNVIFAHDCDVTKPGTIVQHFKRLLDDCGNKYLYKIIGQGYDSETNNAVMIYQALYADKKIYVRPLTEFLSLVDHKKHPDIRQIFRFECYNGYLQDLRFDLLTCFIQRLEGTEYGVSHGFQKIDEKTLSAPYVDYSEDLMELGDTIHYFVDEHPEYGLKEYRKILEDNNLIPITGEENVETLNAQAVLALIFGAFRYERFCTGALLNFCKSGEMLRCLKRLQALDETRESSVSIPLDDFEYFSFEKSGFFYGFDSWEIIKEETGYKIQKTYRHKKDDGGLNAEVAVDIGLRGWISKLKAIRIDIWDKEYCDNSILDGTQWKLSYRIKDYDPVRITGSNKYPPNWNELNDLIKELDQILKDNAIND